MIFFYSMSCLRRIISHQGINQESLFMQCLKIRFRKVSWKFGRCSLFKYFNNKRSLDFKNFENQRVIAIYIICYANCEEAEEVKKYPTYFFMASCALKRITHSVTTWALCCQMYSQVWHSIKILCVDCGKNSSESKGSPFVEFDRNGNGSCQRNNINSTWVL